MEIERFVEDCVAANQEAEAQRAVLEVLLPGLFQNPVTNPLLRFTGGIHIYGGNFFDTARSLWDPETLEEKPSDGAIIRGIFDHENERLGLS
jgi:hypothetical protein